MWLTATERGVAVHPMTSAPTFFALLLQKGGEGLDEDTIRELRLLRPVYERLFQLTGAIGEVLLFRVVYANNTSRGPAEGRSTPCCAASAKARRPKPGTCWNSDWQNARRI